MAHGELEHLCRGALPVRAGGMRPAQTMGIDLGNAGRATELLRDLPDPVPIPALRPVAEEVRLPGPAAGLAGQERAQTLGDHELTEAGRSLLRGLLADTQNLA